MDDQDDTALEEFVEPILATPRAGARGLSPYSFLFTGEDWLRLTVTTSQLGSTVAVHYRMYRAGAPSHASRFTYRPTTTYTSQATEFNLGEGYLLNVSVFLEGTAVSIGQTFVTLQAIRGRGTAATVLGTIVQGYLTAHQDLGWPGSPITDSISGGGAIRTFAFPATGPGLPVTFTVPAGARWELLSCFTNLSTSAAAFDRLLVMQADIAAGTLWVVWQGRVQVASTTGYHWWTQGITPGFVGIAPFSVANLPRDYPLTAATTIAIGVTFMPAGDQMGTALVRVREWLEVT